MWFIAVDSMIHAQKKSSSGLATRRKQTGSNWLWRPWTIQRWYLMHVALELHIVERVCVDKESCQLNFHDESLYETGALPTLPETFAKLCRQRWGWAVRDARRQLCNVSISIACENCHFIFYYQIWHSIFFRSSSTFSWEVRTLFIINRLNWCSEYTRTM